MPDRAELSVSRICLLDRPGPLSDEDYLKRDAFTIELRDFKKRFEDAAATTNSTLR